jgi:pyruvate dehydrogenase E1 component beta subunit
MFMNMPGIKIVVPSNPADMKGLLKTAIRDDDPTIIFEDGTLAGMRGEVPDNADLPGEELLVPFGEAKVFREGTDCTIVGIGGAVNHAIATADQLAAEGISVEVIDPRTLVPFDKQTVLDSVEKTGRLVIADPAHKVCSAASEIASIVAEEGFWSLQAPIQKVASEQVHIPFSPSIEKLVYPDVPKITAAVKRTLES